MSLVDPLPAGNSLARKDKPSGTIKLKKAIVKNTKAKDNGKQVQQAMIRASCSSGRKTPKLDPEANRPIHR